MSIFSTGPIENNPVGGARPSRQVTVKIDNKSSVNFSTVSIQGFALDGSRTLYVLEQLSVAPNQVVTKTYSANFNAFEFVFITGGDAEADTDISVWGKNAAGQLVTAHRLVSSELLGEGDETFIWGEETIIWADSSAPGPGDGTPFDPFNSLQAAIDAATNNPLATTFGMRARLIILIAANSVFNEDIVIPPARHVQLLGLGPWVLGNADLANFGSSIPRNITIQTNQAAENVYFTQGPAFVARPVTVIGTFNNGTSVSTHTNYTDGAIISGNITFQNLDPVDPFSTIEFQLLNANVAGSIIGDPVNPHQGILNTYIYNSRINIMNKPGLRIQRMVDSRSDGTINVAGYSHITNSLINGNVTVTSALADVPPTGIFSSQFGNITWTGPLRLDTASNFYFVNSGSTLVGVKTILFSIA
ncbi:hypothetical protein BKP45_19080 [Anaerobacillus alkalidiazotrophicus]|uniref:Uncharacterized protein n=1 Tax=Anaerobacillus alkalidiazotrophicus TaxID=472963 RepID=A0A1S2M1F5_9BACI|nr:hypothetical protein [Anaerobacillus alkalidiazotrophicus]OIJ18548.1 hypothetical protein BKP45_19080 [Anaerobacillus alkalidiazotrophicus]